MATQAECGARTRAQTFCLMNGVQPKVVESPADQSRNGQNHLPLFTHSSPRALDTQRLMCVCRTGLVV